MNYRNIQHVVYIKIYRSLSLKFKIRLRIVVKFRHFGCTPRYLLRNGHKSRLVYKTHLYYKYTISATSFEPSFLLSSSFFLRISLKLSEFQSRSFLAVNNAVCHQTTIDASLSSWAPKTSARIPSIKAHSAGHSPPAPQLPHHQLPATSKTTATRISPQPMKPPTAPQPARPAAIPAPTPAH